MTIKSMTKGLRVAIAAAMAAAMSVPGLVAAIQSEPTAIERLAAISESLHQSHAAMDGAAYLRVSVAMVRLAWRQTPLAEGTGGGPGWK